jgi:hypothetical protein
MKLNDPKVGTYAAVRVLEPTNKKLSEFLKFHGIPTTLNSKEHRRHVTLLYSRTHLPDYVAEPDFMHYASFQGYELFDTKPGKADSTKCLVMKLNAPTLSARHEQLMREHPATYDFPTYKPHITLSYKIPYNFDVGILPPFNEVVLLGAEYGEDLDLDWENK